MVELFERAHDRSLWQIACMKQSSNLRISMTLGRMLLYGERITVGDYEDYVGHRWEGIKIDYNYK